MTEPIHHPVDGDIWAGHPDNLVRIWIAGEWQVKKLTEEQCVALGGHCYVDTNSVWDTMPPQYPQTCKHCPATRVKIPRDPYEYRDTTRRP